MTKCVALTHSTFGTKHCGMVTPINREDQPVRRLKVSRKTSTAYGISSGTTRYTRTTMKLFLSCRLWVFTASKVLHLV